MRVYKIACANAMCHLKMNSADEDSVQEIKETDNDYILELVVDYTIRRSYPPGLLKDKKRQ